MKVLYTVKHHRKLAIIDGTVTWNGSLNILSQHDSCEIMWRVVSKGIADQLLGFIKLTKILGDNMNNDLPNDYEINEADIDKMLRHLKLAHPEDTITLEMAIDKLEEMYENFHNLAHTNPELLEKWYGILKPSDD